MCEEMNIWRIIFLAVVILQKKASSYLYSCKYFGTLLSEFIFIGKHIRNHTKLSRILGINERNLDFFLQTYNLSMLAKANLVVNTPASFDAISTPVIHTHIIINRNHGCFLKGTIYWKKF